MTFDQLRALFVYPCEPTYVRSESLDYMEWSFKTLGAFGTAVAYLSTALEDAGFVQQPTSDDGYFVYRLPCGSSLHLRFRMNTGRLLIKGSYFHLKL